MAKGKHQALLDHLRREQGIKNSRSRMILSFEDKVSSPRYISDFLAYRKYSRLTFEFLQSTNGSDPGSVVEAAKAKRDQLKEKKDWDDHDSVWVIIDTDHHQNLSSAIDRALQLEFNLAISSPCFEYWILLHFENSGEGVNSCDELIAKKLKVHLPNYDKGKTDYTAFISEVDKAVLNARLQHKTKGEECPSKTYPATAVYKLIEAIDKTFEPPCAPMMAKPSSGESP